MSTDHLDEKAKWDKYFSDLGYFGDEEHVIRFNQEFVNLITELLPKGGRVLEAGCGGGLQSLYLAKTGKFDVTLMDFSNEALDYARGLFARENMQGKFLFGDVFEHSPTRDYDLVFNLGVLEHYTLSDQISFLQGMASRSKSFVLALVPNRLCYWYWIWRIQTMERGEWTYGTEVPLTDLSESFKRAGLHFIGQSFIGADWSESFILDLQGIEDTLRTTLLSVHRSSVITQPQKSYLLAALGSIFPQELPASQLWQASSYPERIEEAKMVEDLAIQVAEASRAGKEAAHYRYLTERLSLEVKDLLREKEELIEANRQLVQLKEDLQENLTKTRGVLNEIYSSRAWKLIRVLWRIRLFLMPPNSLQARMIRGAIQSFRNFKKLLDRIYRAFQASWFIRFLRKIKTLRQNQYAYAFDNFKRLRNSLCPSDLRGLRCPSETGLVSIILPVYNGAAMLRESLDSILAQSYENFEIIAIDDGSTDETPEILEEYARRDQRIRVIRQENAKLPKALSRGFAEARGEFLTWTSHDNRMKPDFLEILTADLSARPCVDMVYANKDIIGDAGEPLRHSDWYRGCQKPLGSEHIYLPDDTRELNTFANNSIGGAFMYRDRVAWLVGDYSPIRFTTEDYDYWMLVNGLLNLKHSIEKIPIYEYRFHAHSLTSRDKELRITQDRDKLMAFEDFRRDFYLTPLVWFLDAESADLLSQKPIQELVKKIHHAGHLILDWAFFSQVDLPKLWMPCIYLHITAGHEVHQPPPEDLPESALKVLLSLSRQDLTAEVDRSWDVCFSLGVQKVLPRLQGKYQGWFGAGGSEVLFTALDIRARTDHLRYIESLISRASEASCKLSVVICTYQRTDLLLRALQSVADQTLPKSEYEIIISNNDPTDQRLKEQIDVFREENFSEYPEHVRLIVCPIPGLSHARNAAISIASGEILCFLDDDAVAGRDWLSQVEVAFKAHPQTGLIGGHIRLVPPDPKPAVLHPGWEQLWGNFQTRHEVYTEVQNWWEYPWGGNWCARRQAMIEIGGFRGRYGRSKKNYAGGEEIVAAALIQQLGYAIAILPEAEVDHIPAADRFTMEYVRRTIPSGLMTIYQEQKDLYIPRTFSLPYCIALSLKMFYQLMQLVISRDRNKYLIEDMRVRLSAYIRVTLQLLKDNFLRFRKPVVKQKGCPRNPR